MCADDQLLYKLKDIAWALEDLQTECKPQGYKWYLVEDILDKVDLLLGDFEHEKRIQNFYLCQRYKVDDARKVADIRDYWQGGSHG